MSCRWRVPAVAALQPDGFSGEQQHPSQHRPERWSIFFRKCTGKVRPGIVDFFESERLAGFFAPDWVAFLVRNTHVTMQPKIHPRQEIDRSLTKPELSGLAMAISPP